MVNIFYAKDFETKEDLFTHAKNEILQADDKDISYEGVEPAWGTWVYDRLIEDGEIERRGVKYVIYRLLGYLKVVDSLMVMW